MVQSWKRRLLRPTLVAELSVPLPAGAVAARPLVLRGAAVADERELQLVAVRGRCGAGPADAAEEAGGRVLVPPRPWRHLCLEVGRRRLQTRICGDSGHG